MNNCLVLTATLLALLYSPTVFGESSDESARRRPNIVVILADDLGYGDVSCYNPDRGKIPTPHIDRLASQGMRFTDGHSSSGVCSPSRYTLLTGRYHWRSRLQRGIVRYLERPLIARDRLTIAGLLRNEGYQTGCFGKWHLGWDWEIPREDRKLFGPGRGNFPEVTDRHRRAWREVYSEPIGGGPTTRGFDHYFGTDVPNWPPYSFIENGRTVGIPSEFLPKKLFRGHLASLPGPAVDGWKLEEILPTTIDHAREFIERRSQEESPFFVYLPLTSPHTPLAVASEWRGESGLDRPVADFIMQTDAEVGRVLEALESSGVAEETLVLFTSDNGFAPYVGAAHLEEQGHYPSGPLRGYKADAWEGGHRVPFIVRWPGVVRPGTTCEQLVHHADLMASVAAILGTDLPTGAGEDSVSLLPLLRGSGDPVRDHAVSQGSNGVFALRRGAWKMIFGPGGGGYGRRRSEAEPDGPAGQLYNLDEDLGETNNLYEERPKLAEEMTGLLRRLVNEGRSTPGPRRENDVPVKWTRYFEPGGDGGS